MQILERSSSDTYYFCRWWTVPALELQYSQGQRQKLQIISNYWSQIVLVFKELLNCSSLLNDKLFVYHKSKLAFDSYFKNSYKIQWTFSFIISNVAKRFSDEISIFFFTGTPHFLHDYASLFLLIFPDLLSGGTNYNVFSILSWYLKYEIIKLSKKDSNECSFETTNPFSFHFIILMNAFGIYIFLISYLKWYLLKEGEFHKRRITDNFPRKMVHF